MTATELSPHHAETVANLVRQMEADPTVRALVLGGSLAHGFARADSDVDVTIVVDTEEYQRRVAENRLHHNDTSVVTYEGGYIDGKYVDTAFLRRVAEHGSDPARFAYADAQVLFSREPGLTELLASIARYPVEEQQERMDRFAAQLLAWRWYFSESVSKQSRYLEVLALHKLALFTCRLVLTANAMLYPYHKWLMRVTEQAPHRPADLMERLDAVLAAPTQADVDALVADVLAFYEVDQAATEKVWPTRFMKDTELAWQSGHPPIDDL